MRGSLAKDRLPELICSLNHDGESGILNLSRDKLSKQIYFGQGSMVFASSNYRPDRLGEYLVRNGKITRTHFDLASEKVVKTGQRLGKVMVHMGLMLEREMLAGVEDQLRAIIYSLFPWDRGEYRFVPRQRAIASELEMQLPTYPTILEGIRGIHDPALIRRSLGNLDRIIHFKQDPATLLGKVNLTPEESYVASRVDDQSSIADILRISPVSEAQTLRCLYGLLSVGILDLGEKSRELTPTQESDLSEEEHAIHQDVMAKFSGLDAGTYYDWLEVSHSANGEEIKSAFYAMAKTYHLDRLRSPKLQDLKRNLAEILLKVTKAYQVLSDPIARRRYDSSLRTEAPRGEGSGPRALISPHAEAEEAIDPAKKAAEQHYQEAKKHFAGGDYHLTAELMDVSLRLDPSNASFHKLQAKALAKNPNWRIDAEEHFQVALKTDPFDVECLIGLGELYEAAGLARKSERMFFRALGLDPENEELKKKLVEKKQVPGWKRWIKMRLH